MKKLYLEFIRGAAAVTVLIYHFLELHSLSNHSNHFYFANWGTDAVMIFFILSGVVINISQTSNPKHKLSFLASRVLRLYPQLVVGLLLGLGVLYITQSDMPSAGTIAGNFLMISAVKDYMINIVPSIQTNSPIWSLSYEIVFYLAFALTIGRFQKKAIFSWFVLSLAVMPLYYFKIGPDVLKHFVSVFAFSSIWLTGYYIYEYRKYFYTDRYTALFSAGMLPLISRMHVSSIYYDPAKYLLFALFAIAFFRHCLQEPKVGFKIKLYYLVIPYLLIVYTVFNQPYLTFLSFMVYAIMPIALLGVALAIDVFKLKDKVIQFIGATGKVFGKYSYSIYIIHYPILFLCAALFHNIAVTLAVSLSCVALLAYSLETFLQPAVVGFFRQPRLLAFGAKLRSLPKVDVELVLLKRIILPLITAVAWLLLFPFNK